jgi:hypothetical protein
MFPRDAHRRIGFGLFKRIRTALTPSVPRNGSRSATAVSA